MLNGYYAQMTMDIGHGYGTGKSNSSKCEQITDSDQM